MLAKQRPLTIGSWCSVLKSFLQSYKKGGRRDQSRPWHNGLADKAQRKPGPGHLLCFKIHTLDNYQSKRTQSPSSSYKIIWKITPTDTTFSLCCRMVHLPHKEISKIIKAVLQYSKNKHQLPLISCWTSVLFGPLSVLCTIQLAILVKWPMYPYRLPPSALQELNTSRYQYFIIIVSSIYILP